jgi:anti-sigma factor RsiW
MMECLNRNKIFAFAHRMVSPNEEVEVGEHMEKCAACRKTADEYRSLEAVLDEWKPAKPTPEFDAHVRGAIARAAPALRGGLFGLGWKRIAPALSILVVLLSVVVVRERGRHARTTTAPTVATPGPQPVPPAQIETPDEQAESELTMYQNLSVLEDYDMLRDFDVLSEMPRGGKKIEN